MVLVAVYGTLKKGEDNYKDYLGALEPIESGFFQIPYKMYSNGYYPMLITSTVRNIFFEIYEVSDDKLNFLDSLEYPYGYQREILKHKRGDIVIYVFKEKYPPRDFIQVESGNFVSEKKFV